MKTVPVLALHKCPIWAGAALFVACGAANRAAPNAPPANAPTVTAPMASAPPMASTNQPAPSPASTQATAGEPAAAERTQPLVVSIEPRSGSKLHGTAKFESVNGGVQVTLDVLSAPAGKHGAHIHQNADCSAKDGKSAGDHFNPQAHEHGLPPTEHRHLGDLGNLEVGKDGKGHLDIVIAGANLTTGDNLSFLDRGIIIHEKVDNGDQPAGNAGNRIGCGEIKH